MGNEKRGAAVRQCWILGLLGWAIICPAEEPDGLAATMDQLAEDLAGLQVELESSTRRAEIATFMQDTGIYGVTLTSEDAAIYKGADTRSEVLTQLPEGRTLPVIDKFDGWYAVEIGDKNEKYRAGWVQASDVVPNRIVGLAAMAPRTPDMYHDTMDRVKQLQQKYSDNPYVRISGFSVEIGIPPTVSITFEFK